MVFRHKAVLRVRQVAQRCAQHAAWTLVALGGDGCRKCGVIRGRPSAVEPTRHRSVSGVTTNNEAQGSSVLDAP